MLQAPQGRLRPTDHSRKDYVNARYSLSCRSSRRDLEALAERMAVLHERTETICKEYITTLKPDSAAR